ncbi:MAG: hypothetical protein RIB57_13695 [Pelagibacterium sp.]|uniref:hypothetical protein n=1 Tax=Pelagibacterium sp. TaxID=1967288 RepID=UPI0032ED67A5
MTTEQQAELIEQAWSKTVTATHLMHFLMADLEFCFDRNRATIDGNTVTLKFQRDSIDATLWLAGEASAAAREAQALSTKALDEVSK